MRLVNVLASAGSASELFLRQARAGVPLTVTDTGMMRYWITGPHAALLLAHGALLAHDGSVLATPHDPAQLSVGELAERIWRAAGAGDDADIELLGIRRGETLTEVLTGAGRAARARAPAGDRRDRGRRRPRPARRGWPSASRPAWGATPPARCGSRRCAARACWSPR